MLGALGGASLSSDVGRIAPVHLELPYQAEIVLVPVANCRLRAFSATVFGLELLRRRGRKFGRVSGDPSDFPSDSYRWVPSRKVCSMWTSSALLRWTIASGEHDILHMQVAPNKSAAVQRRSSLSVRFGHHWPGVPERGRSVMSALRKSSVLVLSGLALVACSKPTNDNAESRTVIEDAGDTNHPAWVQRLAQLKVGATRAEVEGLLPQSYRTAPAFGSSGMHREFYTVSNAWQVAVIYRSADMRYIRNPKQPLIEGPIITRLAPEARDTYKDPNGSFILKKVGSETNR
jgi:hypothetical protein